MKNYRSRSHRIPLFLLAASCSGLLAVQDAAAAPGAHPSSTSTASGTSTPPPPPPATEPKVDKPGDGAKKAYDNRFVQQVRALRKMSDGLRKMCRSTTDAIAATGALTDAIRRFIDADVEALEKELANREMLIKGLAQGAEKTQQAAAAKTLSGKIAARRGDSTKAETFAKTLWGGIARLDGKNTWCSSVCSVGTTPAQVVDMCAYADDALATAAMIADPSSVEAIAAYVVERMSSLEWVYIGGGRTKKLTELGVSLEDEIPLVKMTVGAKAVIKQEHSEMALDIGAMSMRTLDVALAALARVIEDRAKREGLVWFLERMHDNVCKTPEGTKEIPKTQAVQELRTYWLKNTCSLADKRSDFMQYGGGAALLRAFQGAVASDVRRWPGAAAGFAAATTFLASATARGSLNTPLECHGSPSTPVCDAVKSLRQSTAKLTDDLMVGVNVGIALDEYSVSIDRLNRMGSSFFSSELQLAACAASTPLVFQEYDAEVTELGLNRFDASKGLLLGALTRSPACFAITGEGWPVADCNVQSSSFTCGLSMTKEINAQAKRVERLTTLARFADKVDGPARALVGRWGVLRDTTKTFEVALKNLQVHANDQPPTPPKFDVSAVNDAKTFKEAVMAVQAYADNTARSFQQSKQVKFLQTSAALAHAGVDFGVSLMAAGKTITTPNLLPGLCSGTNCSATFGAGHDTLVKLSTQLDAVEAALVGDWGKVVPQVIAEVRSDLALACNSDMKCMQLTGHLSRYAGVLTALATDPDPEAAAQALDAAAMPIGGWRRKLVPGATTISIAAFPGFAFGAEWRYGQYGATYERFRTLHFASPTLTLPVGIDISHGGWNHWFISLLDPAAYLQYDGTNDDRLPGAQAITALAPGLAWRVAPWDAPISLNVFGVFRPNLRAWETGWSTPSAHAFQLGLNVSIDVTLFELFTRDPDMEAK